MKSGPSLEKENSTTKRCLVNFYFVAYSQATVTLFKTVVSQTLLLELLGELLKYNTELLGPLLFLWDISAGARPQKSLFQKTLRVILISRFENHRCTL